MVRKGEIVISVFVTLISLGVYYYLFACADRKIVFLYEHLGLTPFDRITTGRYWMTGLVLSAFLTIFYLITLLIMKLTLKSVLMSWKSIVLMALIPLTGGVVFITMTTGEPELPFSMAISSAFALIFGIAIGFSVATDLTENFKSTLVYLISGLGLVPFLLLFRVVELPEQGLVSVGISILVLAVSLITGFIWLLVCYRIFRRNRPGIVNVLKGTLTTGYIGLPLLHYMAATPKGIPYITSSDNFFADSILLRIAAWIALIALVYLVDKLSEGTKAGG